MEAIQTTPFTAGLRGSLGSGEAGGGARPAARPQRGDGFIPP